jgi:CheY-like chemotaxis protein
VPRILVADDNTNIQKMVTLAFQERGVDVVAVGNGEAAVRRIPDANPDLVLADVFMPVRNGYEVCEFVKKDSRFAHIPVILLVGAFDPLDEKEARRVGADGVLKKPFVPPDPLIAMVMSALEKNPRVMAEWAKQKEAAAAAAAPPPMPAMEIPAKAEPKPLPHFPEPTPEEAAVIYGFGKGVRGLDADEEESVEKSSEPAAPKASEVKSGPKISSGPKTSVSAIDDDDEEYDDVATATDRRRANTDFEVPENVSADPIYSYGRDFEPITFPSEKDVPPKHVKQNLEVAEETAQAKTAEAESSALAKEEETSEWDIRPASEIAVAAPPAEEPVAAPPVAVEETPAVALTAGEVPEEKVPVPFSFESKATAFEPAAEAETFVPKPLPERVFEAAREAEPAPAVAASIETPSRESQQDSTSRGGWMDMMSPLPDQPAATHWMESLSGSAPETHAHAEEQPLEVQATSLVAKSAPVEAVSEFAHEAVTHQPAEIEARATETAVASAPAEHDIAAPASSEWADEPSAEPRSFSDSAPQFGSSSYHFASSETAVQHDSDAVQQVDEAYPIVETPAELMVSPADAPRDEAEPEHAPSESLFVTENMDSPSGYAAQTEEPLAADPQPEPAFAKSLDSQEGLLDPTASSFFEASEPVAKEEDFSERIPTLPPTNREALSDIPFLMPPSVETHASGNGSDSNVVVDDVVRKVLEKLQPQLQEMLSQGMKPLLENLVQSELQKKDR